MTAPSECTARTSRRRSAATPATAWRHRCHLTADPDEHRRRVEEVRSLIEAGGVYKINTLQVTQAQLAQKLNADEQKLFQEVAIEAQACGTPVIAPNSA